MKKLSEFMKEEFPLIDIRLIAKILEAEKRYKNMIHGQYCHICYKELSRDERYQLDSIRDFSFTCEEHREYRDVLDIGRVRHHLGLTVEALHPFDL